MRRAVAFLSLLAAISLSPLAAQARVDIRVDLSSQTMHVEAPDGSSYRWAISSGKKGFRTPTGVYSSRRLARMHYSSKYDDAPMPHSIFFRGGYAIHATGSVGLLGRPASHGCIRLAPAHAAKLFTMVKRSGARIAIIGAPGEGGVYARRRARAVMADADEAPRARMRAPAYLTPGFVDAPRVWSIDGPAQNDWILR